MKLRDMVTLNMLEEIALAARRACSKESVCETIEWCCQNPRSRTARKILCHLANIMNRLPAIQNASSVLQSDQYRRELSHAVDVLIYDLHYELFCDVDAADRVAIMALLV